MTGETYRIVNIKTHNTSYIHEASMCKRVKGGGYEWTRVPVVSMIGFGPLGKSSRWNYACTLREVKRQIKILLKYPKRRKDLSKLRIEKYDKNGNAMKTYSMERFIKDAEQELIMEKLKA